MISVYKWALVSEHEIGRKCPGRTAHNSSDRGDTIPYDNNQSIVYFSLLLLLSNQQTTRRLRHGHIRNLSLILSPLVYTPCALVNAFARTAFSSIGMLALPLYPASIGPHQSSEPQFRPAKDIETFNKLLPPVVEFVEGSSSGTLLIAEGKYEPVNGSPKAKARPEVTFLYSRFCFVSLPR
jgi:hypothetical protein